MRNKTPLIPVCQHCTETLKFCRSAVFYREFPLQQMIKTYRNEQEVPSASVFLCIASSVACQPSGINKSRDNTAAEFVLNGI